MNLRIISIIVVTLITVLIFIYMMSGDRRKALASKLFLAVMLLFDAWAICTYLIYHNGGNAIIGGIFCSLASALGFLVIYIAFLFSHTYPIRDNFIKNTNKIKRYTIAAMVFAAISALPIFAGQVLLDENGKPYVLDPPLEVIYLAVVFMLLALIIIRYVSVIRSTRGAVRAQAWVILFTIVFGVISAVITSIILPLFGYDVVFQIFVPPLVILFSATVIFLITRKGFFDVRPIIARSLTHIMAIATLLAVFIVVTLLALAYIFNLHINVKETIFFAMLSIVLAISYQPVKRMYESFAGKFIYYDGYNPQLFLNNINEILVDSEDISQQLDLVTKSIESTLKVSFVHFYIDAIKPKKGSQGALLFGSPPWKTLVTYLEKDSQKIFINSNSQEDTTINGCMKLLNAEIILKLMSHDEVVGYVIAGFRRSRNNLTTSDIQVLEIVADEVAVAVQNSLRLTQISRFNSTLQQEIASATSELKKSNEKLLQLDKAKDEFISMASHQLRTPLTSIKGYISIILDGDTGEITSQQKSFLTQAFVSSQHMAYVIGDLLNLSRIKTGTFVVDRKPVNLPNLVENEISVMQNIAQNKGITLVYSTSGNIPLINLDDAKIRQVVMNFIDNAIHYTPKEGTITVTVITTKKEVLFAVKDTGIGVPKAEQAHVFGKFYRASNARHIRPDGTGIGLYMAKKVITAQGGSIIFKTVQDKGSTFGFSFPLPK